MASELYSLGEALLDGCLELNDHFLSAYCGSEIRELLGKLPEGERAFALQGCLGEGDFPCGPTGDYKDCILLPHGEIEIQFEGKAEDFFAEPEEYTIRGDLAYLYTGYGAEFTVDCKKLSANVASAL